MCDTSESENTHARSTGWDERKSAAAPRRHRQRKGGGDRRVPGGSREVGAKGGRTAIENSGAFRVTVRKEQKKKFEKKEIRNKKAAKRSVIWKYFLIKPSLFQDGRNC